MKTLCIFDLDGTLLDTLGTISGYANEALVKNGVEPIEKNEYKYLVGKGASNLVAGMLRYRNCYSEELFARVFADYNDAYNKNTTRDTVIYPGVRELLDALKARGVKIAIVSNKPDFATRSVVSALFGEGYFDEVHGQREGIPIKPDPTAVFEVMLTLGASAEDCIYAGDTGVDMQTGKNAGLWTVGVLWGFRDRAELIENGADAVISEADELLKYL
jgi:phosphoglycolate phosphatase